MKTNKDINYELVFKGQNNQVLTNSLLVAEKFGKEHSDVLRAIDALVLLPAATRVNNNVVSAR